MTVRTTAQRRQWRRDGDDAEGMTTTAMRQGQGRRRCRGRAGRGHHPPPPPSPPPFRSHSQQRQEPQQRLFSAFSSPHMTIASTTISIPSFGPRTSPPAAAAPRALPSPPHPTSPSCTPDPRYLRLPSLHLCLSCKLDLTSNASRPSRWRLHRRRLRFGWGLAQGGGHGRRRHHRATHPCRGLDLRRPAFRAHRRQGRPPSVSAIDKAPYTYTRLPCPIPLVVDGEDDHVTGPGQGTTVRCRAFATYPPHGMIPPSSNLRARIYAALPPLQSAGGQVLTAPAFHAPRVQ
ncbi:hypothetical protein EW146_g1610 [Bondarzewia mesenterica]|uniref:Uncharacterized protein n=1 Tax=Bondarzewia mesenterica TaxID=1095465 RepID=A0A4S4M359_9AGAM|nr:hypothetical protein EW146_g1610 [Bondarzewia mesenterica]